MRMQFILLNGVVIKAKIKDLGEIWGLFYMFDKENAQPCLGYLEIDIHICL